MVPKLRTNRGVHSVKIPEGLKAGAYMIRPELFTLHEADVPMTQNKDRGIQLYLECVQLVVEGSGNVELPQGVSFPGGLSVPST